MSKSMEGGKSGAIEGSKKRNPYIMPTIRQLAYLDELKTRLLLMRERQAIFMEQTAKMLNGISSVNMVGNSVLNEPAADQALPLPEVNEDEAEESKSNPNIKTLIQRFEDLCQTSQKFTDLPDVPEELVNVDVRRILKGYEKLIEEENIIQQSWLLLRNSTESCVRFTTKEQPMEQPNPANLTEIEEESEVASKSSFQVIVPQILTSSLYPNVAKSEDSEDKEGWKVFEPKNDFKESSTAVTRELPEF
ncbi:uncharacterized protein [Drosophila kikkawai]|uniref:Uncharacterized protein isoform X2 n=1 Tax=Drosophila kikkawai TaxID=30033 RepID=A0A6P4IUQ4_DROKI|nr:uncharacterized protein LOC108077356 isoform X2 [Drosophila kikkawai]